MLFYDICLTFGEEVEKIWSQRFSLVTVLWFMVSSSYSALILPDMVYRTVIYRHWATL